MDEFGALDVCLDAIEDLLVLHLADSLGFRSHWLAFSLRLDRLQHIWIGYQNHRLLVVALLIDWDNTRPFMSSLGQLSQDGVIRASRCLYAASHRRDCLV